MKTVRRLSIQFGWAGAKYILSDADAILLGQIANRAVTVKLPDGMYSGTYHVAEQQESLIGELSLIEVEVPEDDGKDGNAPPQQSIFTAAVRNLP